MKKPNKKLKAALAVVGAVLALLVILATVFFLFLNPYRGTDNNPAESLALDAVLTAQQAQEDIDVFYERITSRHPAWLDGSEDIVKAVEERYLAERAAIADDMTALEVWQACARIAAVIEDGHTWVLDNSATDEYLHDITDLQAGNTVTAINGESTADIFARFKTVYPNENESFSLAVFSESIIIRRDYLELCGVDTSDGVVFTFEGEDGLHFERHYSFTDAASIIMNTPSDSDADSPEGHFSWRLDEENKIALFDLDECIYDSAYRAGVEGFFAAVRASGYDTVVIDLRGNGGGNSLVANEFFRYLDFSSFKSTGGYARYGGMLLGADHHNNTNRRHADPFDGEVYVLMDVGTYSSAMLFALYLGDNGLATLVGEASGNMPDSYGDCLIFSLPNSRMRLSVSYKIFTRPDASRRGQPLEPDIECEPEMAYEVVCGLISE